MNAEILQGDSLQLMPTLAADSIDSIITDPPYGLSFMGKNWDKGIPGEAFWREALRVAKPGAHLLAFGGTRTHHRLACAIEDAGWEIRDCVMWVYGSGFPKSHDVSKAIDKRRDERHEDALVVTVPMANAMRAKGLTRRDLNLAVGREPNDAGSAQSWTTIAANGAHKPRVPTLEQWTVLRDLLELKSLDAEVWRLNGRKGQPGEAWAEREVVGRRALPNSPGFSGERYTDNPHNVDYADTVPATDAARQWEGWGTALKPAWEPIIVARKPLCGTVAENVLKHGTGALNIDECRVAASAEDFAKLSAGVEAIRERGGTMDNSWKNSSDLSGANPANPAGRWPANVIHDGSDEVIPLFPRDNNGTAARFFYCAKASKTDRDHNNTHPTVKPTALMRYLCRLVTPPNGTILDPFTGSGSTGKAAMLEHFNFIGIELQPEYAQIAQARIEQAIHELHETC